MAVIYVDADMLYSGYVRAAMLESPAHVLVRRPDHADWRAEITAIIRMTAAKPHLVIIDTINGLGITNGGPEGIRWAVRSIMLLASLSESSGTQVVVAASARKNNTGWELAPGGRLIPNIRHLYTLEEGGPVPLPDAERPRKRRHTSKRRYEMHLDGKLY